MREHGIALPADGAPIGTQVATSSVHALVVTMRGTRPDALDGTARPVTAPIGPQTTQRHDALVMPLRTHGSAEPAAVSPVPTVVAGNAGHALLVRNYSGGASMTRPVAEPSGTVTAVDHHALLVDYHGAGRPWQVHPVADPMGTVETVDRRGLVTPRIAIEDCGFRMLEPHEIGRAMAFDDSYVVLGNKRDRVRQYGNAVTPPVMSLILGRAIGSLAGGRAA